MKTVRFIIYLVVLAISGPDLFSQKETWNWYFGNFGGIDFSTNPPAMLTNGALNTLEGSSSISDANGNLLFYTDGVTVYNKVHATMLNGSGLAGSGSTSQAALIVKQPGNPNIYFVFTLDYQGSPQGLSYSTVDMSLAAGMGSVTSKNVQLQTCSTEKLAGALHCNGVDVWVVSHDYNLTTSSNTFRAYLVTSAGISNSPVLSNTGTMIVPNPPTNNITQGCMKISPNGKKLATVSRLTAELFDFDNSTGSVSNGFALISGSPVSQVGYGCEFSSDSRVLYASSWASPRLYQWDLCASAGSAIAASQATISSHGLSTLQLAVNGKIYCARANSKCVDVIDSPNLLGTACNFVDSAFVYTTSVYFGLPNFVSGYFAAKPVAQPFTYSINCLIASLVSPSVATTGSSCAIAANPVLSQQWSFGDPLSGAANTSTLANPSHTFSTNGTFSVQLIRYYQCSSDTVTLPVVTSTAGAVINVSGNFNVCKGEKRIYNATGASSYSWAGTSVTTSTLSLTHTATSVYTVSGTTQAGCSGSKSFTVNVQPCSGFEKISKDLVINLFPNPFSEKLLFQCETNIRLNMLNIHGQQVFEASFAPGDHFIDTAQLCSGIYFVRAVGEDGMKIIRVSKIE